MMFRIFALENTPARLCASASTTSDPALKDLIVQNLEERGYIVSLETEE